MVNKPKVVIVGAGIAGLSAAKKLYTTPGSSELLELCVVEGGDRIGGRIMTAQFCGDKIEKGATWIHGIQGNPIYIIAQENNLFESDQPGECMEELEKAITIAEGGHTVSSSIVDPITEFFNKMLDYISGEGDFEDGVCKRIVESFGHGNMSAGSFLRKGLEFYLNKKEEEDVEVFDKWSRKSLEEGVWALRENMHRLYTAAGDLGTLDFHGESEYSNFPGDDITIAKGFSAVIESLASALPPDSIQLGRKVTKIEWQSGDGTTTTKPVKLHFSDGSFMYADHVIFTASLGVLKQGIREENGLFSPPLPSFKTEAISRLGFGVVDKLFLQLNPTHNGIKFPNLQLVFHQSKDAEFKNPKIPLWLRRTAFIYPIYANSSTVVAWFAGKEALEMELLDEEEIIDGLSTTMSQFLANSKDFKNMDSAESCIKFSKVLKCKWGTDPLFLGSYSYLAVGSSGDDFDAVAEPLPKRGNDGNNSSKDGSPLQILFAGEGTQEQLFNNSWCLS